MTYAFHWRKAIALSLFLHVFLLLVTGCLTTHVTTSVRMPEEILLDLELVSSSGNQAVQDLKQLSASASAAAGAGKVDAAAADINQEAVSSFPSNELGREAWAASAEKNNTENVQEVSKGINGLQNTKPGGRVSGNNAQGGGNGGTGKAGTALIGGNFMSNGDGTYTALSPAGINYTIVQSVEANYPEEARAVGYTRPVCVEAEILVGLDGSVEAVTVLNHVPNLGFREAARAALLQWKFSPIYHQGVNIKMKFYKNIYFDPV